MLTQRLMFFGLIVVNLGVRVFSSGETTVCSGFCSCSQGLSPNISLCPEPSQCPWKDVQFLCIQKALVDQNPILTEVCLFL